jgi:hypothetical protein
MRPTNIGPAASGVWKRVEPSSSILTTLVWAFLTGTFIHLISDDLLREPRLDHLHLCQLLLVRVGARRWNAAYFLGPFVLIEEWLVF